MACKAFELMAVYQNHVATQGNERLDLALLYFFQTFRKNYIGENSHKASPVYSKLSDTFRLTDGSMVLNMIAQKLASNLKVWATNSKIVLNSLTFLSDIASG
jgi:exportin-7